MKPVWIGQILSVILLGSGPRVLGDLSPRQLDKLPPPANRPIQFKKDIQPIFEASCIKCHGHGRRKGGFRIDTRETLLKGGKDGPVVVPHQSAKSLLIELVSGLDPDEVMPRKGSRLTRRQVGLMRAWIDQGLPWPKGVTFARPPPVNLFPRNPPIPKAPPGIDLPNPIDRFLAVYFKQHHINPGHPVSDAVYARRVYLDTIGLLPPPAEMEAFLQDNRPDKRARLVERLLGKSQRYAEHWLSFWNDALRNDYKGTGYIDGGRRQITTWLFEALADDLPFNRFVADLVNPSPESEGFIKGIVWRGVVNASQRPEMQAARNISQVFMGVNLKCASCHDSFINDLTLEDSYGLASVYAKKPMEVYRCDRPTGRFAEMKFLYPELGHIDRHAPRKKRLKELARIITRRRNGRLTRTIVNRLWARFLGRGLIEPRDNMDNPAWDQDLLDWLASDLANHGYDLKRTMALILTSRAYQLPSVPSQRTPPKNFVFRGPLVRRMTSEEFRDAMAQLTGIWYRMPLARVDFWANQSPDRRRQLVRQTAPAPASWIWNDAAATNKAPFQTVYFRKRIRLPAVPDEACVMVACDNRYTLYVNGKRVSSGSDFKKPGLVEVRADLQAGDNVFAVEAKNEAPPDSKKDGSSDKGKHGAASGSDPCAENPPPGNPAGLFVYVWIRFHRGSDRDSGEQILDFGSDRTWLWTTTTSDDWEKPTFDGSEWIPSFELGPVNLAPWKLAHGFEMAASAVAQYGRVRASLVAADPLSTALGRPSREQVVTSRDSAATTLQGLELTNGRTLADLLKAGARRLLKQRSPPAALIGRLYEKALDRKPTADELALCEQMVGKPPRAEGVEDFLWAVAMLPEFQLIY